MEKTKLTIDEALAEGYTMFGYEGKETQNLIPIEKVCSDDFEYAETHGYKIVVADTDEHTAKLDADDLLGFLADRYRDYEENPDDTDDMEDYLKEEKQLIDDFVEKINIVYAKKNWFYLTEMELIKS
jgi:hypothetical protein